MKKLILVIFLVIICGLFGEVSAQAGPPECPVDLVCITRDAAVKAVETAKRADALEKELAAVNIAFEGLRTETQKLRIEYAEKAGENTALKQNAVSDRAIIEILLKGQKKKCMPLSLCLF